MNKKQKVKVAQEILNLETELYRAARYKSNKEKAAYLVLNGYRREYRGG